MMAADAIRCHKLQAATASGGAYWRIHVTENHGGASGYEAAVVELEFRTAIGGASASTDGTAIASTFVPDFNTPDHAFDGSNTTRWMSERYAALPQWVGYQHPGTLEVVEVAITASNLTQYLPSAPKSFTIDVSSDGVAWNTVATVVDEPAWGQLEQRVYTLVVPAVEPVPWSPTDKNTYIALSGSGFVATKSGGSNAGAGADGASAKTSGAAGEKLYAEFEILAAPTGDYSGVGFSIVGYNRAVALGANNFGYGYHCNGSAYLSGSLVSTGTPYAPGDVIGIGIDLSTGAIEFFKNGVLVHSVTKTLLADYEHVLGMSAQSDAFSVKIVTDSSAMAHPMPSGYTAWSFNA